MYHNLHIFPLVVSHQPRVTWLFPVLLQTHVLSVSRVWTEAFHALLGARPIDFYIGVVSAVLVLCDLAQKLKTNNCLPPLHIPTCYVLSAGPRTFGHLSNPPTALRPLEQP